MRYLFVNTAGAFSQDYKVHGFQSHGHSWNECTTRPEDVLIREVPFSSKYTKESLDLGSRARSFSIWITKNADERKIVCVITLKGVSSATRRDFTGRIIFDSVALIYTLSGEAALEQSVLLESETIARGLARSVSDVSATFDDFANMQDFDRDLYPFLDVSSFYSCLSSLSSDAGLDEPIGTGIGASDSIAQLLRGLNVSFTKVPLEVNIRREKRSDRVDSEYSAGNRPDSCASLMNSLVQATEEAVKTADDIVSEIIPERHSARFSANLRRIGEFLQDVKPFNLFPSRKSSGSAVSAETATNPSRVKVERTLFQCTSVVGIETLEQVVAGIFRAANEAQSVALGLLVGDEGMPEIVEGIDDSPSSLVLISIRR